MRVLRSIWDDDVLVSCGNGEIKVVLDVRAEGVVRFDLWSEALCLTAANTSVSAKWMKPTAHCFLIGFFRLTEIRCPSSYNNSFWLIQDPRTERHRNERWCLGCFCFGCYMIWFFSEVITTKNCISFCTRLLFSQQHWKICNADRRATVKHWWAWSLPRSHVAEYSDLHSDENKLQSNVSQIQSREASFGMCEQHTYCSPYMFVFLKRDFWLTTPLFEFPEEDVIE